MFENKSIGELLNSPKEDWEVERAEWLRHVSEDRPEYLDIATRFYGLDYEEIGLLEEEFVKRHDRLYEDGINLPCIIDEVGVGVYEEFISDVPAAVERRNNLVASVSEKVSKLGNNNIRDYCEITSDNQESPLCPVYMTTLQGNDFAQIPVARLREIETEIDGIDLERFEVFLAEMKATNLRFEAVQKKIERERTINNLLNNTRVVMDLAAKMGISSMGHPNSIKTAPLKDLIAVEAKLEEFNKIAESYGGVDGFETEDVRMILDEMFPEK